MSEHTHDDHTATQAARSPRVAEGPRRWRRAAAVLMTTLTSFGMVAGLMAPAHADTNSNDGGSLSTDGPDVDLDANIFQRTAPVNGQCYVKGSFTWEVFGAASTTQESDVEARMRAAAAQSKLQISGSDAGSESGNTTYADKYGTATTCPDITKTDVNRRLSTMGSMARGFAALSAAIIVDGLVVAASTLIASNPPFLATATAYPITWAAMTGCIAGALGTAVGVAIKGGDASSYWNAAVACITEGTVAAAMARVFKAVAPSLSNLARGLLSDNDVSFELASVSTMDSLDTAVGRLGSAA